MQLSFRVMISLAMVFTAPHALSADSVVASRTLRALEIIGPADVELTRGASLGAAQRLDEVIGLEARVMLYAGRPIRPEQLGPPALISRNQLVVLFFVSGGMRIEVEGRALDRAAIGEAVKVLNMASRRTVRGVVQSDGTVEVGGQGR